MMKRQYRSAGVAILTLVWLALPLVVHTCEAVVLNDDYFEASGGDATDQASVFATVDAGYSDARNFSFEDQFLAVGSISGCTATWIGNDSGSNTSFILTAAHCVEPNPPVAVSPITRTFTDWDGNTAVSGTGTLYLPPERYDGNASCGGGACSDIAILELPGQADIRDASNVPIDRPLIYDSDKELGVQNAFVGYGSWGVSEATGGSNGGLFPSTGPRRAGATNVINSIFESDKGISASFNAPGGVGSTIRESSVAAGDSGSAWWQQHLGVWSIIATTNGGSGTTYGTFSTGARTSQYVAWIESIYPDVHLWSDNVLFGDINLDGAVSTGTGLAESDDVTAFVDQWLLPNVPDSQRFADLNEDGLVDLSDAFLLNEALIAAGGSFDFDALSGVPEPGSSALLVAALATVACVRLRRPRAA